MRNLLRLPAVAVISTAWVMLISDAASAASWATHDLRAPVGKRQFTQLCDLAIRSDGRTVATWTVRTTKRTYAFLATRKPGGAWQDSQLVWSLAGLSRTRDVGTYGTCPHILLGKGSGHDIVWEQHSESRTQTGFVKTGAFSVRTARARAGRVSSPRTLLANAAFSPDDPPASAADGSALILVGRRTPRRGTYSIRRLPSGQWERPKYLTQPQFAVPFRTVFDSNGNAVVVWPTNRGLQVSVGDRAGAWLAPRTIAGSGLREDAKTKKQCVWSSTSDPVVLAGDERGRVLIAFACASPFDGTRSIRAATLDASGIVSSASLLTAPVDPTTISPEDNKLLGAQFDSAGNAHVAWLAHVGSSHALETTSAAPTGLALWAPVQRSPIFPGGVLQPWVEGAYGIPASGAEVFVQTGADATTRDGPRSTGAITVTERGADGSWAAVEQLGRRRTAFAPLLRVREDKLVVGWTSPGGAVIATR